MRRRVIHLEGVPRFSGFLTKMRPKMTAASKGIFASFAGRAVGQYMRDAGAGAGRRDPADRGPLRIVTGRLAGSLNDSIRGGAREGIRSSKWTKDKGVLLWGTRVPYGKVNEEGFSGIVRVSPHTRTITQAFGRPISPRQVDVVGHTKLMNIPPRPFAGPAVSDKLESTGQTVLAVVIESLREAMDE